MGAAADAAGTSDSPRLSAVGAKAPIHAVLRDAVEIANTPFRHVQDLLRFPISEWRMRRRLAEQLRRGTPLVVYSAIKTASTAVAAAHDRMLALPSAQVFYNTSQREALRAKWLG